MSIFKHFACITLSATLLSGCGPVSDLDTSAHKQKLGNFYNANSSQAFGLVYAGETIRGIFYSTTPPTGTAPSPTGYWLRSQNSDYYAPIDSITYNDLAVTNVETSQGWLQVTDGETSQVVKGTFDLQFRIGGQIPGTLRIQSSVDEHSYGKYMADWRTDDQDGWSAACPHPYLDSDNATVNLPEYMIPVGGAKWLIDGRRIDDATAIQLSCTHDSIGGCITWGYAPWDSHNGTSLKNTHQACTRMKRADFCGTGDPATTVNQSAYLHTEIQLWDSLSIHTSSPQTISTMEAFWDTNGATCFNQPKYRTTLPNYVAHMQALLAACPQPKPACGKGSTGLVASARPCTVIDPSTGNCVQN